MRTFFLLLLTFGQAVADELTFKVKVEVPIITPLKDLSFISQSIVADQIRMNMKAQKWNFDRINPWQYGRSIQPKITVLLRARPFTSGGTTTTSPTIADVTFTYTPPTGTDLTTIQIPSHFASTFLRQVQFILVGLARNTAELLSGHLDETQLDELTAEFVFDELSETDPTVTVNVQIPLVFPTVEDIDQLSESTAKMVIKMTMQERLTRSNPFGTGSTRVDFVLRNTGKFAIADVTFVYSPTSITDLTSIEIPSNLQSRFTDVLQDLTSFSQLEGIVDMTNLNRVVALVEINLPPTTTTPPQTTTPTATTTTPTAPTTTPTPPTTTPTAPTTTPTPPTTTPTAPTTTPTAPTTTPTPPTTTPTAPTTTPTPPTTTTTPPTTTRPTTTQPTTSRCSGLETFQDAIVTCETDEFSLTIPDCVFITNDLEDQIDDQIYLSPDNQPTECYGQIQSGNVYYNANIDGCSATESNGTHYLRKSTLVYERGVANSVISRRSFVRVQFACATPINIFVSIENGIASSEISVNETLEHEAMDIEVGMGLFQSQSFSNQLTNVNDFTFDIEEPMFVGISMINGGDMELRLKNCWATPE